MVICRYSLVRQRVSGLVVRQQSRSGSSWHQSAALSSDSAPSSPSPTRPREDPESIVGLRGTISSPRRAIGLDHHGISFDTNAKSDEDQLQSGSTLPPKIKQRLNNKCIAFVRSSLGLKSKTNRASKDAIFVAIDTEGTRDNLTELGISTFDTRDIKDMDPGPSALEWAKQIKPRQFRFKAGQRQPFLFGAVEHRVPLTAIQPYLKLRSDRLYILVGHALNHDIDKIAHALGYQLRNEPNVVAIVDTYALVQQCRMKLPGRLSELWRFLVSSSPGDVTSGDVIKLFSPKHLTADMDYMSNHAFHNAGNDAFYNMHTLLMLALRPELLREPQYGSSLAGVFLTARSAAWQLVRRLSKFTPRGNPVVPGSFVRRPEGVSPIQPPQSAKFKELTLSMKRPKT